MLKRQAVAAMGMALLILPLAGPVLAQDDATIEELKREIQSIKQGQQNIQRQLNEIKQLLQQQKAPARRPSGPNVKDVVFNLSNSVTKGDAGAKLTLIEFTDYQ